MLSNSLAQGIPASMVATPVRKFYFISTHLVAQMLRVDFDLSSSHIPYLTHQQTVGSTFKMSSQI